MTLHIPLTGAGLTVKLQMQESAEKHCTLETPQVRPAMQSRKAKFADSEIRSIGYETMTTVSDLDSEVRFTVFLLDNTHIKLCKQLLAKYGFLINE